MNFEHDIQQCLAALNNGQTILYPTDTIWGIGCDASNEIAVAKIYNIKKRNEKKSMIILLATEADIKNYAKEPNEQIIKLMADTEKPITIIYTEAKNLAANLINEDGSIAIRVVKDEFCQKLITAFGKPIVSTSANISGEATAYSFAEISDAIKNKVDYSVTVNRLKINTSASKIILWDGETIKVIRE